MALRQWLIKHYESTINELDVRCETVLSTCDPSQRLGINELRERVISRVKSIEASNYDELNAKRETISKFCFFLTNRSGKVCINPQNGKNRSPRNQKFYFTNPIGKLVVLNQLVDQDMIVEFK
jgi:hypothetical protein